MSCCFAELRQRDDDWNAVMQFLDAQDWIHLEQATAAAAAFGGRLWEYRAKRVCKRLVQAE